MAGRSDRFAARALPGHLGERGRRTVRKAAWTGRELDDQALAAAAALTAAQQARALSRAVVAFAVLLLGALVLFVLEGSGWSVGLLTVSGVGVIGSTAAWLVLRRAARRHERNADHAALSVLMRGLEQGPSSGGPGRG